MKISPEVLPGLSKSTEDWEAVFPSRALAGEELGRKLQERHYDNSVVIAIPNGGVPVALRVAQILDAPLHLSSVAKIAFPSDTRFGIGAINSLRQVVLNFDIIDDLHLQEDEIQQMREAAVGVLEDRIKALEGFIRPLPNMAGRTAIIVDDGLATGYSALAAALSLEPLNPSRIVMASPVCGPGARTVLEAYGLEIVISLQLEEDAFLVDDYYHDFRQLSHLEVASLINDFKANELPGR